MTPQPPIRVGDPVRLITRLRPPARIVPYLDGIVESIDGDRAFVRWADGARSSSRLQFLDPSIGWYPRVVHILTQSADLHDRDRQPRPAQDAPGVILAMTTADTNRVPTETFETDDNPELPRRALMSGWSHLVADGQAGPDDGRPHMDPDELDED